MRAGDRVTMNVRGVTHVGTLTSRRGFVVCWAGDVRFERETEVYAPECSWQGVHQTEGCR